VAQTGQVTPVFSLESCRVARQTNGGARGDARNEQRAGDLAVSAGWTANSPLGIMPNPNPLPKNRRELARAIFAQCDPVALGRRLLESAEDRGASTQLRALEMFTEWAYGNSDSDDASGPTRVIWDLPRRSNEAGSTQAESSERGEK